jgi:N-acetylmuramoyl-L-alanine amidase
MLQRINILIFVKILKSAQQMIDFAKLIKIFLISVLFFVSVQQKASSQDENYRIRKVVIDAGHGGKDPGAVGKHSKEKDITLSIALKVGSYIEKYIEDVDVIYTRKTDVFVELYRRSAIANENNADLFISIHVNSNPQSIHHGTSTYVMGLNRAQDNLEVVKLENSVILAEKDYRSRYEGYNPNAPESDIILSLYQNAYLEQSTLLASKIQDQFTVRAGRKDFGVRQAGLIVLWNCTMPSVLVETGFISNPAEEKYLMSDYGQSIIASAIFRAFRSYKEEVEKKDKSGSDKNLSKFDSKTSNSQNENGSNKKDEQKTIKNNEDETVYKIQIKTSSKQLTINPKNFNGIENVQETNENGVYKYSCGNSKSYEDISKLLPEIRKKFPDSFITAYKNGKKLKTKN